MRRQNFAFTLLEVLLALGLSVLVLVAVGMAINLHLRLLDSGRTKVEEAQLARAVLRIIAQDLQSAVPYSSTKSSSSSSNGSSGSNIQEGESSQNSNPNLSHGSHISLLTAAIGMSLTGANNNTPTVTTKQTKNNTPTDTTKQTKNNTPTDTTKQTKNNTPTDTTKQTNNNTPTDQATSTPNGSDTTDSEDRTGDIADTGPASTPGLYGNANQLQVDISRLPRVDQYMAISNQSDAGITNASQASDVKNVAYYVINGGAASTPGTTNGSNVLSGLVRREMSRAPGVYASQQGGQFPVTSDSLTPIAPEVQEIDFSYSDGTQWLDTWDSVSNGGLPVAVQISIVITPQHPRNTQNLQSNLYRLLVSIPSAQPTSSTTSSTSSTSSQ
ncbi:MAG: hypothetical protein ABSA77_02065 [Thermoguttaceae bacterium]